MCPFVASKDVATDVKPMASVERWELVKPRLLCRSGRQS